MDSAAAVFLDQHHQGHGPVSKSVLARAHCLPHCDSVTETAEESRKKPRPWEQGSRQLRQLPAGNAHRVKVAIIFSVSAIGFQTPLHCRTQCLTSDVRSEWGPCIRWVAA
jgi:hypothetical protein